MKPKDLPSETEDKPVLRITPKLLSVKQSCDVLGIGRTNFYGLVAEGRLTIVKLGRRTLVPVAVLDEFVATLPTSKAREPSAIWKPLGA